MRSGKEIVGIVHVTGCLVCCELTSFGQFSSCSVVTCNSGPEGLNYHAASARRNPKMQYKTSLRLDGIPKERVTDPAFWTIAFSQWMKMPPSEYHRAEVLYDVLLPWLAGGRVLPEAMAETIDDKYADWRSPQVSFAFAAFSSVCVVPTHLTRSSSDIFSYAASRHKLIPVTHRSSSLRHASVGRFKRKA